MAKALRKLQPELTKYNQRRQDLIEQFAEKDDAGQFVLNAAKTEHAFKTPQDLEDFNKAFELLNAEEIDAQIDMISIDDIADVELIIPKQYLPAIEAKPAVEAKAATDTEPAVEAQPAVEARPAMEFESGNDFTVLAPLIDILLKD